MRGISIDDQHIRSEGLYLVVWRLLKEHLKSKLRISAEIVHLRRGKSFVDERLNTMLRIGDKIIYLYQGEEVVVDASGRGCGWSAVRICR